MQSSSPTSSPPAPVGGRGRFILIFVLVVGGYFAITTLDWVDRHVVLPVLEISASGASWILGVFGVVTQVNGVVVKGPEFSVAVRNGCDPLAPIALMAGAMLGFPSSARQKWLGVLGGALIMFVLNLVRVATLYLTGRAHSSWFYSLHQEWWPAAFIAVAMLLWWGWLNWVRRGEKAIHD